ncbi:hypothetical protein LTS12_012432 [Elasticomyces elasticus]|nr:hypothetical protein LTS12_012432 [Elasticomyces elasticus]
MNLDEDYSYPEQRNGSPSVPFGAIWSALTSQYGAFTAEFGPATNMPTAVVTVPYSTVTVQSTILQTAFVTVTTGLAQSEINTHSSLSSTPTTLDPVPITTPTSSTRRSLTLSSTFQSSASQSSVAHISAPLPPAASTASPPATLPAVIVSSVSSVDGAGSLTVSLETHRPVTTASATASSSAITATSRLTQKHAIIGGLSGAIASFVMIGAILFFCLRKRRRRNEVDEISVQHEDMDEKGFRPTLKRKWTELTSKGTPKPTPQLPPTSSPITIDEEHHIIRMNTQHWARPYALGHGEGYRESVGPGQLRVTNPDTSRPVTPGRTSSDTNVSFLGRLQYLGASRPTTPRSDTAGSYLGKQRSRLAAVMLTANRSRTSSRSNIHDATPPRIPEIVIDPQLSRECIAPQARTPSLRSYKSATSHPYVQQHPPEDPFLTPPDERDETTAQHQTTEQQRPARPSLAPLQSAARTLSHIGSVLNPFSYRTTSVNKIAVPSVRNSTGSISTWSAGWSQRNTGMSDPFDLDRPSVRGSNAPASDLERGRTLFHGT